MSGGEGTSDDATSQVQVQLSAASPLAELAAAAAGATPLAELDPSFRDLSRVSPLFEQLAATIARLLDTDMAVVWVTDPSEELLVAAAWVGFPDEYISPMRLPYGTGSAGRAVAERTTVLVEDIAASPHYAFFREGALANGVRAVLSVPMLTLIGEPMGALSTYYHSVVDPDQGDLELVELYARQAAEIVERARLHGQARLLAALERRRAVQLRALADSALALSAADSLNDLLRLVTEAALEVIGCHQAVTTRLPSGQRVQVGAITSSGAVLEVPLVGREGSNLGIVQLSDKVDETAFSSEDEAILVQLAQMASSAIERLEAFEGERSARREAQAAARLQSVLSDASAVFAESFDPQGIAAALAELIVPRMAELAIVHVVDRNGEVALAALQTADPANRKAATTFFASFPISTEQPYGAGAVLATGRPQLMPEITQEIIDAVSTDPDQAAVLGRTVGRSGICVPLTARGRVVGVVSMSRDDAYGEDEVDQAVDLARRAALALDNANRYAFERDMAVTLQRSLLPRKLPTGEAFRAAARYLPGARGTQVGGDWYDIIEVGGALVLVVGDVMGRGVQAAAVMGQLQATVRAYALDGHSPAEILTRLDRVVLAVDDLHFTTCVVARLDPTSRQLCLASAGHLPPVLVVPGTPARLLELEPGLPLGVGGAEFVEQTYDLEPGALLMLYTDGLVEGRGAPIEDGMDHLVEALSRPVTSVDEACERVLRALGRDGDHDDDTAVLALLLTTAPDLELRLPTVAASAPTARHAVRALLTQAGLDPEVAQLLVTELVANAVRHAGPVHVDVRATLHGELVRVEVDDNSGRLPGEAQEPRWEQESGRGLLLVETLSDRWGAEPLPTGKRVWFELAPGPVR